MKLIRKRSYTYKISAAASQGHKIRDRQLPSHWSLLLTPLPILPSPTTTTFWLELYPVFWFCQWDEKMA